MDIYSDLLPPNILDGYLIDYSFFVSVPSICFLCKGLGILTRQSHPFSLNHTPNSNWHMCGLCYGLGAL